MRYTENTKKSSSSCSRIGRPIKGFESWRKSAVENAEKMEFVDYLKACFEEIEKMGGEVFLGYVEADIWIDYELVKAWNCVKVIWEDGTARYRAIESFKTDYENEVKKFETKLARIAAGY